MTKSVPLALAGESGDPDVHQLLAELQTHRVMHADAEGRLKKATTDRDLEVEAIAALEAELTALGFRQ